MRLAFLLSTLLLLAGCGGTVTGYNPVGDESPSSLRGSEGAGGVQTDIWSSNPSQKTLTNDSQYGP